MAADSARLVSASELAVRLNVSISTIRRWANDGTLPGYRLGGPGASLRFDLAEVERWLRSDENGAA